TPRPLPSYQRFMCVDEPDAGFGAENLPYDNDLGLTQWLLRDFVEHLPDAGARDEAKYLRLKVDRILAAPIFRARPPLGAAEQFRLDENNAKGGDAPHSFIGGEPVDPELLDGLVDAARALLSA